VFGILGSFPPPRTTWFHGIVRERDVVSRGAGAVVGVMPPVDLYTSLQFDHRQQRPKLAFLVVVVCIEIDVPAPVFTVAGLCPDGRTT